MYLLNPEDFKGKMYCCKRKIANYIIKKEIPLLSFKNDIYYFAMTQELEEVLKNMPWYLRLFNREVSMDG